MRVRHRIPSIFNLSMVDVLCCALGCVILLWLINLREAKTHEENAAASNRDITSRLDSARAERDAAYDLAVRLGEQMSVLEAEKADIQKRLIAVRAEADGLSRKLQASGERVAGLEKDLRASTGRYEAEMARAADLERKLKGSMDRVRVLEVDVRAGEKRQETETARGRDLARKLAAMEAETRGLRADLKDAKKQYAAEAALARALEKEINTRMRELKEAGKNLEGLQASRRGLERDLETRDKELAERRREMADAARSMAALQGEKKALQTEAARVRAAADNRFAGIELTGRRVVFLVDMSGSMERVDENTPAPHKWAEVRGTVARLMRSLPDLEKYQVIVFSEKASFLFTGEEDWLDYDGKTSPARVLAALGAIKPEGGTDMYGALQAAFRLRARGLDTIYLLSDGLPNLGEGLSAEESAKLKEVERNDILARHIRKTLDTNWNRRQPGRPRVRINTVGFFFESPDVGAFLWALARENDGSFVGMSKP